MTSRVSLAELAAAGIQLRPAEAVAIVSEICRQYSRGWIRGIPSPGVIRLTCDGAIVAEGPITTGAEPGVRRAAHLLSDLLPEANAGAAYRASGGLRLVVARALGTLDLPPYATLEAFCDALSRFSAGDLGTTVRHLIRAWEEAVQPADPSPALTISDIRRARRATGLSLDDLSAVADVPAARLRELEWGFLRNWPKDDVGRGQVVRYARSAGLDEAVVLSIAWPMIEEAAADRDAQPVPVVALVPAGPHTLTVPARAARRRPSRSRLMSWSVVAVATALLALATFGVINGAAQDPKPARVAGESQPVVSRDAPAPPVAAPPLTEPPPPAAPPMAETPLAAAPALAASPRAETPVPPRASPSSRRPASVRRPAAARQSARPAAAPPRRTSPRNRSFFHKELFRIVIR
jgi:cytoskeletal protein RodZ